MRNKVNCSYYMLKKTQKIYVFLGGKNKKKKIITVTFNNFAWIHGISIRYTWIVMDRNPVGYDDALNKSL